MPAQTEHRFDGESPRNLQLLIQFNVLLNHQPMNKFFRKIRYDLMSENKTAKYFKYAIGEIILVVIGILIALSINNWNEQRKNAIKEETALTQLKKDLDQTYKDLDELKEFFKSNAQSAKIVLHSYWTKEYLKDTLLFHFGRVGSNRKYSPNISTAQSLINSGRIDLVSSEELKTSIIKYIETVDDITSDISRYEETYYRPANSNKLFSAFNLLANYNPQALKDMAKDRELPSNPKEFESAPFPISIEDIYANKEIFMRYESFLTAHRNTYWRYTQMQEETGKLLQILKNNGYD